MEEGYNSQRKFCLATKQSMFSHNGKTNVEFAEEEEVAKNNVEPIQGDEGKKGRIPMSMTIGPEVQIEEGVVRCVPRDDRGMLAFKASPLQIRRSAICAATLRSRRKRGPACAMRHRGLDLPQFDGSSSVSFWLFCRLVAQSYQTAESVEK
jgi:hypothetical protein